MTNIREIPVNHLHPHPSNPRKILGDLSELAASIKTNGVMQNLTVVPDDSGYTVVIGHRRLAAAKQAGLETVPCAVVTMDEKQQLSTMLMENVQRSDLTAQEQAQGFQLILNLGETVESVSKSTGFSESTVRRRLKLLELDQDLLMRAESRGGTMRDYEQLNQLHDPELRNQVLVNIGTPNFNNALKQAKDREAQEKRWQNLLAEAESFATEIKKRGVVNGETVPMEYAAAWSKNSTAKAEPPPDGKTYYYIVDDDKYITFYRELPEPSAEQAAEKAREKERRAVLDRRAEELKAIEERHRQLRTEFVHGFRDRRISGKDKTMAILRITLDALMDCQGCWSSPDMEMLTTLLGRDIEDEDDLTCAIADEYWGSPCYTALAAAVSVLDGDKNSHWITEWADGHMRIRHKQDETLDILYRDLAALGYEMSDEERQLQDGTHPLFNEEGDQ